MTNIIQCDVQVVRSSSLNDRLPIIERCEVPASSIVVRPPGGDVTTIWWLRDGTEHMLGVPGLGRICNEHADSVGQHPGWDFGPQIQDVCFACRYVTSEHGNTQADVGHENLCCGSRSGCQWEPGECQTHDMRFATIEGVTPPQSNVMPLHYHHDTGDLPYPGDLDADCHTGEGLATPNPEGDHDTRHRAWQGMLGSDSVMLDDAPEPTEKCYCGFPLAQDPDYITVQDTDDYEDFGPVVNADGTPTEFTLGMFGRQP